MLVDVELQANAGYTKRYKVTFPGKTAQRLKYSLRWVGAGAALAASYAYIKHDNQKQKAPTEE